MAYSYEIYDRINNFKGKDKNRMHMPGHKNSRAFAARFPVAPLDITELSFSDDLSCPTGKIKKAQEDLAEITGAKRAYITTDGSTSGVLSMLYVAAAYGNKLIVPRNSHKSVFNACRLLNVEPVIVQGEERDGVLLPPAPELIEKLIVNDVNISGLIVTSPDYYGNIAPLKEYSKLLKKYGRLLFADGAHGAHLCLEEGREGYCGVYADMWVDGAHKSLPTLTQGALICVGNEKLVQRAEEAIAIFRTSSPSYPVMASVEYGYKYYINNPKAFEQTKAAVKQLKESAPVIKLYPSQDWTKLAVDFKALGVSPDAAQTQLEKRGIYPEMNDGRYILFYLSPSVAPAKIAELGSVLLWIIGNKRLKGSFKERPSVPVAERTYSFLYALKQKTEWVDLEKAEGRMCALNAGLTPPCLPVIIAGEMVSKQAIELLSSAKNTFGVTDGKIKVVRR